MALTERESKFSKQFMQNVKIVLCFQAVELALENFQEMEVCLFLSSDAINMHI